MRRDVEIEAALIFEYNLSVCSYVECVYNVCIMCVLVCNNLLSVEIHRRITGHGRR